MNWPAGRWRSARIRRNAVIVLVGLLVLAALMVVALRVALWQVQAHAAGIQQWIERETDLRIEFERLDARLRWFGPEIVLEKARVLDREGTQALFETREGRVGLDMWNFFRTGELAAARVHFVGPSVTVVRLPDGRIRLLGLRDRPADRPLFDLDRLPAGRVVIEDARVTWRDLAASRPPLTLENVRLSLRRERRFASVSGSAQLPSRMGAAVEFEGRLKGPLDTPARLAARLEVRAAEVLLPGIASLLPRGVAQPLNGRGSVAAEIVIAGGRLKLARLDFGLEDVRLRLPARQLSSVETVELYRGPQPPGRSPLALPVVERRFVPRPPAEALRDVTYAALAGELRLRSDGSTWVFRARRLLLARPGTNHATRANVAISWRGQPATTFATTVAAENLRLDDAWPLVLAFAPPAFDPWATLAPSGEIRSLRLEASRDRAGAWPRFAVEANFGGLAVRPTGRWPGFSGLSGTASGSDAAGLVSIRSAAPGFEWPRIFVEPLALRRADADIRWSRSTDTWTIESQRFELDHESAHATGSCAFVHRRGEGSPRLTLEAKVDRADVALVPRVLPYGRIQPGAIAWLEQAFLGGRVDRGSVSLSGPLQKFPFRRGEGQFTATADVSGVRLSYAAGFPPLVGAAGHVEFHQAGLAGQLTRGEVGGLAVKRGVVSIADLHEPVVEVASESSGDLAAALAIVQGSPLGPLLGQQFMGLSGSGPADYSVHLSLPTHDMAHHDYKVGVDLHSVTIASRALRAPARNVTGSFALHGRELRAPSLRGTMLDGPFELTAEPGAPAPGGDVSVVLRGGGRAAGARLPDFIGLPQRIRMAGSAQWNLDGTIRRRAADGQWLLRLEVGSDLQGLEIAAPDPFAKSADVARPTRVELNFSRDGPEEATVQSGSARARLAFVHREGDRWDLERGVVRFDGQPVVLPDRPGMRVSGAWPSFDLGEWLALGSPTDAAHRVSAWLGPTDVHLDEARVLGFEFRDVAARLQPSEGAWRVNVAGPMAQGEVTIPFDLDGGEPIRLDMARLQLQPAAGSRSRGSADSDPRTLPAVSFSAQELSWKGHSLGQVRADITKDSDGLRLTGLEVRLPECTIEGRGSWVAEAAGSRTRLELELTSSDLAATAKQFGYPGIIEAEQARAQANLSWPGGPAADMVGRLGGVMHVALDRGQLLTVKPGAGRLLSLTSISALPRRLSLDFRDVTDTGLAFDSVRGDFELRDGSAYTDNLLVDGAAVDIGVVGRTGLAARDYDQTVVVSGNPSGPLTMAGALAGGPVGAAGGLLLSQIFKGQLEGLARVYYRVTGPWANPVVERISSQAAGTAGASGPTGQE